MWIGKGHFHGVSYLPWSINRTSVSVHTLDHIQMILYIKLTRVSRKLNGKTKTVWLLQVRSGDSFSKCFRCISWRLWMFSLKSRIRFIISIPYEIIPFQILIYGWIFLIFTRDYKTTSLFTECLNNRIYKNRLLNN